MMNQTDPPQKSARSVWQPIGEIILPVDMDGSAVIYSSLQEKLASLQLTMDLIHTIGKSILEIMERAREKETGLEHVHLFLYIPANYRALRRTWGFFRIERIGAEGALAFHSHAVDLYLYPE